MKRIIDGHLYDTRVSILIGEKEERGSFMYKNDVGEFFIYHEMTETKKELPRINPISRSVAIRRHFRYNVNQLDFKEAFGE
ncbi:hypothetical protein ACKUB1_08640 [Methanospirillum stamsii]|uniref:Uncharacterized protein n=1 Tax=Methanospirillum stamsii TaxID=1277351 RepID=A0A2V2N631_9EURY|nr:hypothetical protein [Methanospirillum stamsii]PWR75532.1 hypothetical protein DLD82_05235 [Methanospirillum stamsii]